MKHIKTFERFEPLNKNPKEGDLVDTYSKGIMSIKYIDGNIAWLDDDKFYEIEKLHYAGDDLWYSPAAKNFYDNTL